MKSIIRIILFIVLVLGIAVVLIGAAFLDQMHTDKIYNNGICPKCGTEFHLVDIEGYGRVSYAVRYFYACENGHIIECRCQPSIDE